ncbi:MAG TPA: hypothetical protein VKA55_10500 [Gammaproteobacteria bacterium]|nr:hypothetical protein [Gammaproteobacteria bacterium]
MDPVAPSMMLAATVSAAMIILLGAAYAGLFAWARLRGDRRLEMLSLAAYAGLAAAVAWFTVSLDLQGAWRILVVLMLAGYLFAPRAVWQLCVKTHSAEDR